MKEVKTLAYARNGEAYPVTVQVETQKGLGIHIVGLEDTECKIILLSVTTAMMKMGYRIPGKKIIINIEGPTCHIWTELLGYAIMVALIEATSDEGPGIIEGAHYVGEVTLDGRVRPLTEEQYWRVLEWKRRSGKEVICANSFPKPLNIFEHRG